MIRRFPFFLALGFLLCLAGVRAQAQGVRYDNVAQANIAGVVRVIPNAPITVCTSAGAGIPCSPTTPIFSDIALTIPITQPGFTADANGNFGFYAAPGTIRYSVGSSALAPGGALFTVTLPVPGNGGILAGNLNIKGPIPWADITAFTAGGLIRESNLVGTATCVATNHTVTVGSSGYDFLVGDAVALSGCGNTPATAVAPTSVTATPYPTTGTTTYNYKVVCMVKDHSLTAASANAQTVTGPLPPQAAVWQASHVYALNAQITDQAGHIQKVTANGTSGSTYPTFNHAGGTTTDGTVTWTDQGAGLSLINYIVVAWTAQTACTGGSIVYGDEGSGGALTQLGWVDDNEYLDTGYQIHNKISSAPTNPPAAAVAGLLETSITAINGTTYTLAAAPATSNSALLYHDGEVALQAAVESCNAPDSGAQGCTVRIPGTPSTSGPIQLWFSGFTPIDLNAVNIVVDPNTYIQTIDSVPMFRTSTGTYLHWKFTGGHWAQIVADVATPGQLNNSQFENMTMSGAWGSFYVSGQTYQDRFKDVYLSGSGRIFEYARKAAIDNPIFDGVWEQTGAACSTVYVGIDSSGAENGFAHNWDWKDGTFEGYTQNCPNEGAVTIAGATIGQQVVLNWMMDNVRTADFFSGEDFMVTVGGQIANLTAVNANLAVNSADVFRMHTATGGTGAQGLNGATFVGGQLNAASGTVFDGNTCYLNFVGPLTLSPPFSPASNTCGPTAYLNTGNGGGMTPIAFAVYQAGTGKQLVYIQGDSSSSANPTFNQINAPEAAAPSGVASTDILYPDSSTHRWKMNNNNGGADTVVGAATADTLTNKTLTSPVINGTPTGTGINTTFVQLGTGLGNYTGTNTTFANVDATNLCRAITIPTGWRLLYNASGVLESVTAAAQISVSLSDIGTTCGGAGVTPLSGSERDITPPAAGVFNSGFAMAGMIIGDGSTHSISLQAKTANAADAWGIQNSSAASSPIITFSLVPSN